jgi:hypothetical protein
MKVGRAIRLSLLFVLIGFIGGGVRYWRWWPSHTTPYSIVSEIACPLCPNIDGLGSNWEKFVSRVAGGVLNVVPALVMGWLIIGIVVVCRRSRVNC